MRAVVPVHYAGVGCDMAGIDAAIGDRDIAVIEDNAHGLFGSYRGRPLGSLGRFGTLSFHETKNFICGEGGALILNDERDVDRAHVLYDKGTNRREFMLGQVDKYSWQDIGSSFGMSDVLAAFLYGQLEQRDVILAKRRAVFELYDQMLTPLAAEFGLGFPSCRPTAIRRTTCTTCCCPTVGRATRCSASMQSQRRAVDVPLRAAAQRARRRAGSRPGATECPVTDDISGRLLRLPFHNNLSIDDADRVVEAFSRALEEAASVRTSGAVGG